MIFSLTIARIKRGKTPERNERKQNEDNTTEQQEPMHADPRYSDCNIPQQGIGLLQHPAQNSQVTY